MSIVDKEEAKMYLGAMDRMKAQKRKATLSNLKEALAGLLLFVLGYGFVVLYLLVTNAQ